MTTSFGGFPAEGMEFLRELKLNNDREWFGERKHVYDEKVKAPALELVKAVHAEMMRFAPQYVGEPAKCIYRIYRDTRFSKNKTPYKTNVAASFWRNSLGKGGGAGFYFSITPDEAEIGGGIYAPEPDALLKVRRHIEENLEEFEKTFLNAKVKKLAGELWGEQMTRVPKGFDAASPAAEYLKKKHLVLIGSADGAAVTSPKLVGEISRRFEAITPFLEFLNRPFTGKKSK